MLTENIHNRETKVSCVCVAGAYFTPDVLVQSSFGERTERMGHCTLTSDRPFPLSGTAYTSG